MAVPAHPITETRWDQMFPVLDPSEIERVRHFGTRRSYRKDDVLAKAGIVSEGFTIVLSGKVDVTQYSSSGQGELIVTHVSLDEITPSQLARVDFQFEGRLID